MSSRRDKEGAVLPPPPLHTGKSPLHHIFRDTISEILTLEWQSVRPQLLRSLYAFFGNFPLRESLAVSYQQDIHKLSSVMFDDLEKRFSHYFISIKEISDSASTRQKTVLPVDFWDQIEALTVLLRCCLSILTWPGFDQTLILEKAKFLLFILRRLISFDISGRNGEQFVIFKKFRRKRTYNEDGYTTSVVEDFVASVRFLEPADPCRSSLCALLEVFADELLAAESLRKCFACVEYALSQKPLFKFNVTCSEVELVLEVMCAHLILLGSDEQAVENALDRLSRHHIKGLRISELGISAALNLLLNHMLQSAPLLFQAHLILLVSEAIDADVSQQNMVLHVRELDCYLMAFEKSLYLYKRHISSFWDGKLLDHKDSNLPSFRSCIMQGTWQKLDLLDAKAQTLWEQHMLNKTLESKSDLLSASMVYIKENADVTEETCRDEILSVLYALTMRAFSGAPSDDKALYTIRGGNPKSIYFLSSILRLMSSSMLRIVWCLKHSGSKGQLNMLEDFNSCRGYELLIFAIRSSLQFNAHLPFQSSLVKKLKAHPISRHKESNRMLLHFSGLLSLSFVSGFDFLVKSCLSVMLALLNLIAFEEGNLAALRSLLGPEEYESSPFGHLCRDEEAAAEQRSSEKRKKSNQIASTFLKFQRHCQGIQGELGDPMEPVGPSERAEETCSGEVFLKCLLEGSEADYSDLADFIEFKEGKDYSLWLKNRQKYRKWRLEKTAVLRWKRKKMTMKMINRRRR